MNSASNKFTIQPFSTSALEPSLLEDEEYISSIELGAYHLGVLPKARIRAVEAYLKLHPSRVAESGLLDSYLAELEDELPPVAVPEASPTLWERVDEGIKILIANLVGSSSSEPAFALLGEENGQQIYEADEVELLIQVEDDDEVPNRKALLGLIMGIEPDGLMAHLWQANPLREVVVVEVDEFGNFICTSLESAQYELILSNNETEIHIPNITV